LNTGSGIIITPHETNWFRLYGTKWFHVKPAAA
jgi:hypothetical protein